VPIAMGNEGLALVDGVEAKEVLLTQLAAALQVIKEHDPARIVTLGGECAVSVAPFSALARRYGDDLAIVWIDSNPDIGTPASQYPGLHAMAVSVLTGHGDTDFLNLLPATIAADRVALVGLHEWTEDDYPNIADWGIQAFSPEDLRQSSQPLSDWLARPAAPGSPCTSMLTQSTATRSSLDLATPLAGSRAPNSHALSAMSPLKRTSSR